MSRRSVITKRGRVLSVARAVPTANAVHNLLWRVARLERQVQTLSELVRSHAEDADRLVKIVAENRDVLQDELLREYQTRLRARKRLRPVGSSSRSRSNLRREE
ncbi:MAG: hypothetical protein VST65_06645 [Nitrospirota bacterium]|nr:hypothetical protein [Nitrospirota bacterium]